jgi:hypothetical protein
MTVKEIKAGAGIPRIGLCFCPIKYLLEKCGQIFCCRAAHKRTIIAPAFKRSLPRLLNVARIQSGLGRLPTDGFFYTCRVTDVFKFAQVFEEINCRVRLL